uniref:Uncharacterized protein n=1 Tax=uncultured marine thaumarchaeote KM3_200_B02 TaxID=1456093 RepID=A0A075GZJ9_9ARCH|nr:hypothetical protein [uncultured marine thaumarchaeote KM3_200_B02]
MPAFFHVLPRKILIRVVSKFVVYYFFLGGDPFSILLYHRRQFFRDHFSVGLIVVQMFVFKAAKVIHVNVLRSVVLTSCFPTQTFATFLNLVFLICRNDDGFYKCGIVITIPLCRASVSSAVNLLASVKHVKKIIFCSFVTFRGCGNCVERVLAGCAAQFY